MNSHRYVSQLMNQAVDALVSTGVSDEDRLFSALDFTRRCAEGFPQAERKELFGPLDEIYDAACARGGSTDIATAVKQMTDLDRSHVVRKIRDVEAVLDLRFYEETAAATAGRGRAT